MGKQTSKNQEYHQKLGPIKSIVLAVYAQTKVLSRWGRDISSPAIWATKIFAHFGDNNAQMPRKYVHIPQCPNCRSEAERRAIWPCLNVATWRRERSDLVIQQIC